MKLLNSLTTRCELFHNPRRLTTAIMRGLQEPTDISGLAMQIQAPCGLPAQLEVLAELQCMANSTKGIIRAVPSNVW